MKRILGLLTIGIFMLGLIACGSTDKGSTSEGSGDNGTDANIDEEVEISFYLTGSMNMKDLWDEIIPMFEKEHPNIKVDLVHMDASGGPQAMLDRMEAAKAAGKSSGIDVFSADLRDVVRGNKEGLWAKLDEEKVPNMVNVEGDYLEGVDYHGVPYRASSVVLAYNSENVPNPPQTADELYDWIRNNPGKFAYNDPATGGAGNSFMVSAIYNFLEPEALLSGDHDIMDKWDQGFELLKELHPYMYGEGIYPKKNEGTMKILSGGEVDMVPVWSDMALEHIDRGLLPESTKLIQIDPPLTGGPVYMLAINDSEHLDAVYKFIDFSLSSEPQSLIVNNLNGYPGIKFEEMPQEAQEKFEGIEGNYRLTNLGDLEIEMQKRWQKEVATQ